MYHLLLLFSDYFDHEYKFEQPVLLYRSNMTLGMIFYLFASSQAFPISFLINDVGTITTSYVPYLNFSIYNFLYVEGYLNCPHTF